MAATATAQQNGKTRSGRALPGSRSSCALLTLLTILLAWPSPPEALRVIVLPAYFALLSWFFWTACRGREELQGQPMRLVRGGFLVLLFAFTASAVVHFANLQARHGAFSYLREVCEQGALFLLGITLISYGLMLWIPRVMRAHEILSQHLDQQTSELIVAESARSELEQRLVDADRRALLGELAASIAHDLRNPLTIVVGTAESLCRKQRTREEIAEHTGVIRRNIDKANHTLSALIDLGRPRAHTPTAFPARGVVTEVLGLIEAEGRRRAVDFVVRVDRGIPEPTIWADRSLLAQALLNLLLNALQAAGENSTVTVRLRQLQNHQGDGARTLLAVEDRGPGVAAPVRMRQFLPFHTTKSNGTGLGLWSCRRITEELGGTMALYPRHRGGARVALLLPAGACDAAAAEPLTATGRPLCPATVC